MASASTTTADAILKECYEEALASMLNTSHETLEKLGQVNKKFDGRRIVFPVVVRRNPAVRATGEGGTFGALPSVGSIVTTDSMIYSKTVTGRLGLTNEVVASAKSDRGAFVDAMDSEMDGLVESCKNDLSRQVFGSPISGNLNTGPLTKVSSGATSATQTVSDTRYIVPGMRLAFGTDSEFTTAGFSGVTAANVLTVDSSTSVTLDASVATSTNDIVVLGETTGNAYGKEINGLAYMVAAIDDNFQGVDTGNFPEWKSIVHDNPLSAGTNRDLSLEIMQRCYDSIGKASGKKPDYLVMEHSVRVEYFALLQSQVQYAPLQLKGGGAEQMVFQGGDKQVPISVDKDCTYGTIYFLNTKEIKIATKEEWGWEDGDGAILSRVQGFNMYEAVFRCMKQLACHQRNAHGKLISITATVQA